MIDNDVPEAECQRAIESMKHKRKQ